MKTSSSSSSSSSIKSVASQHTDSPLRIGGTDRNYFMRKERTTQGERSSIRGGDKSRLRPEVGGALHVGTFPPLLWWSTVSHGLCGFFKGSLSHQSNLQTTEGIFKAG